MLVGRFHPNLILLTFVIRFQDLEDLSLILDFQQVVALCIFLTSWTLQFGTSIFLHITKCLRLTILDWIYKILSLFKDSGILTGKFGTFPDKAV